MPKRTLSNKLARLAFRRLYSDRGGEAVPTVFLAGTARSGSTWLANVINHRNDHRLLFEPFHGEVSPRFRHLPKRAYLRPADPHDAEAERVGEVLAGRVRDRWIDQANATPFPRRRLVKEVAGNLMLAWLMRRFPRLRYVLLLRHPVGVVASRMRLGWDAPLEIFRQQSELMEDWLTPFADLLEADLSPAASHALLWAIDYHVPLGQIARGEMGADLHVCCYEHLVARPAELLPPLFAHLGQPFDARVLDQVKIPSSTAQGARARTPLSTEEIADVAAVVQRVGLSTLYDVENPEPLKEPGELV